MEMTKSNIIYLYFVYDRDSRKVYENGVFFKCITAEKRAKGLKEIGKRAFIVPLKLPKDKAFDYDFHTWCVGEYIDDVRYLCSVYLKTATEREEWLKKKLTEYQEKESEFLKQSNKVRGKEWYSGEAINQEEFFAVDSEYKQLELFDLEN